MKKTILFTLMIAIASAVQAAAVDWSVYLTGDRATSYAGSSIYSYALTSLVDSSVTVNSIIDSWAADNTYAPRGDGIWTAQDVRTLQDAAITTGSIAEMDLVAGRNPEYVDYLVVILQKDDGSYMWSAFDGASDPDVYITTRGDTEPMNSDNIVVFNDNSVWTEVAGSNPGGGEDPNVPEPTALALLALGVAGLALKRKVA